MWFWIRILEKTKYFNMDITKQINYWLESAKHDLDVADILFENKKYDWCLFVGYLVIEKVLKAHWIKVNKEIPPKIHNLLKLLKETNIELSKEDKEYLVKINEFNLEVRYPDQRFEFYKICDYDFTKKYFDKIKEIYQCLIQKIT